MFCVVAPATFTPSFCHWYSKLLIRSDVTFILLPSLRIPFISETPKAMLVLAQSEYVEVYTISNSNSFGVTTVVLSEFLEVEAQAPPERVTCA